MNSVTLSQGRVVKNSFSQIVSFGFAGGSKAVAGVIVARSLGPDGLGVFSLSWTLAGTLAFIAILGLDNRLIRELARHGDVSEIERSLPLVCAVGTTIAGLVVLVPYVFSAPPEFVYALAATAGYIAISAPVLILRAAFHARERMEVETATAVLEGVVGLAGAGLAMAIGTGVWGAMLGLTLGRAANLVLSLVLYRRVWGRLRFQIRSARWRHLLNESWPLAVSYSLTASYLRFDIAALAIFGMSEELGFYGAASMITLTTPLLAVAFNSALYPVIAKAHGEELDKVFSSAARALIVVSVPMAAGLCAVVGEHRYLALRSGLRRSGFDPRLDDMGPTVQVRESSFWSHACKLRLEEDHPRFRGPHLQLGCEPLAHPDLGRGGEPLLEPSRPRWS